MRTHLAVEPGLRRRLATILLLFVFFIMFNNLSLAEEGVTQSINITSQRMEVEKEKRLVVFRGNVVAKQEEMTIFSDELHLYYDETGKEVREMVAIGNVRVNQGENTATAQKAEYNRIDEKIVFTGNAKFKEGQNIVEGEKITVYLKEGRSVVVGSDEEKVRAIIFPNRENVSEEGALSK